MLIAKIIGGLALFFGFVVCMAVTSGMTQALWLDTDDGKAGRFRWNRDWHAMEQCRRKYPAGKKRIQIWALQILGLGFFVALIGYLWLLLDPTTMSWPSS
ncbi:hypothetical protein [Asticcacaulis sp. AC402]|uniref:hypothetical protein n=1 Tax=Asticcacaulis sp. AC402 TaxID=1282361 RepID=UPI0003C40054|nr:hypothetical protein [Asticcacaulis sp. AC402]ESQ75213.1 hypothetical protein ABAC402_11125 [Asticcacaulis sp. AC402]